MELFLIIFVALFVITGSYLTGYNLGKQNLKKDYKDSYKEVQNERDNCKHTKLAFEEETMTLLKEAYSILSPISLQWEGRETIPGQMFLASLRSAVGQHKYPSPPHKKDPISKYYEKILQTNSECKHDYMGTLNPDVKMCRKCPAKKRRKPWELGDSFGESWVEDKKRGDNTSMRSMWSRNKRRKA